MENNTTGLQIKLGTTLALPGTGNHIYYIVNMSLKQFS